MILESGEILFFNSITPGNYLLGVDCTVSENGNDNNKIRKGLIGKGLLENDKKLTWDGAFVASMFEDYKKCQKYVVANNIILGVVNEQHAVMIARREKDYEIIRIRPELFTYILLKKTKQFQTAVLAGRIESECVVRRYMFYAEDEKGYIYNLTNHTKQEVAVAGLGQEFIKLFRTDWSKMQLRTDMRLAHNISDSADML